jgi:hypothetical protein
MLWQTHLHGIVHPVDHEGKYINKPNRPRMDYEPTVQDVHELIEDYARDFGETLPFEDARRILILYEELCILFEKHSKGAPIPPHLILE